MFQMCTAHRVSSARPHLPQQCLLAPLQQLQSGYSVHLPVFLPDGTVCFTNRKSKEVFFRRNQPSQGEYQPLICLMLHMDERRLGFTSAEKRDSVDHGMVLECQCTPRSWVKSCQTLKFGKTLNNRTKRPWSLNFTTPHQSKITYVDRHSNCHRKLWFQTTEMPYLTGTIYARFAIKPLKSGQSESAYTYYISQNSPLLKKSDKNKN